MTTHTEYSKNHTDTESNVVRPRFNGQQGPELMTRGRIWKPKDLAGFFGVSIHWVYKRTATDADDPIPRIPGVGRLAFDTQSSSIQAWMGRHLGVDTDAAAEQS